MCVPPVAPCRLCDVKEVAPDSSRLERAFLDVMRYALVGDDSSARELASQMLANMPTEVLAPDAFKERLSRLLIPEGARFPGVRAPAPAMIPRDTDSTLPLVITEPGLPMMPPVLNPTEGSAIDDFIREQQGSAQLATAGLHPARTLLLKGPPGVGKTMTARFIAALLELTLVSVDLVTVVSSYLGQTGQNLRRALDYARSTRCVLFLDEFDALAKRRDDNQDIGEVKRMVNVLLLELDRWPTDSILIAATNHEELLDRAVERRFDAIISLGPPMVASRRSIVVSALGFVGRELHPGLLSASVAATEGWSGSDLARLCRAALRRSVMDQVQLDEAMAHALTRALAARGASDESADAIMAELRQWI